MFYCAYHHRDEHEAEVGLHFVETDETEICTEAWDELVARYADAPPAPESHWDKLRRVWRTMDSYRGAR